MALHLTFQTSLMELSDNKILFVANHLFGFAVIEPLNSNFTTLMWLTNGYDQPV